MGFVHNRRKTMRHSPKSKEELGGVTRTLNLKMEHTGPKVSSPCTSMLALQPSSTVGSKNSPPSECGLPPANTCSHKRIEVRPKICKDVKGAIDDLETARRPHLGALLDRVIDVCLHLLQARPVDHGTLPTQK